MAQVAQSEPARQALAAALASQALEIMDTIVRCSWQATMHCVLLERAPHVQPGSRAPHLLHLLPGPNLGLWPAPERLVRVHDHVLVLPRLCVLYVDAPLPAQRQRLSPGWRWPSMAAHGASLCRSCQAPRSGAGRRGATLQGACLICMAQSTPRLL